MQTFERLIPILAYDDIAAAHDFLVNVFGFSSGGVMRDEAGHAVHGEVLVGDAPVWLHRVTADHGAAVRATASAPRFGLVVHVGDVDAHYARARAGGAQIDQEPVDQPYGQREYGARDCDGYQWWFATLTGKG